MLKWIKALFGVSPTVPAGHIRVVLLNEPGNSVTLTVPKISNLTITLNGKKHHVKDGIVQ